jgi:hypothetical protein
MPAGAAGAALAEPPRLFQEFPPAFAPPLITISAPDFAAYDALMGAPHFDAPIGAAS